jgi:hypothetical protein
MCLLPHKTQNVMHSHSHLNYEFQCPGAGQTESSGVGSHHPHDPVPAPWAPQQCPTSCIVLELSFFDPLGKYKYYFGDSLLAKL